MVFYSIEKKSLKKGIKIRVSTTQCKADGLRKVSEAIARVKKVARPNWTSPIFQVPGTFKR